MRRLGLGHRLDDAARERGRQLAVARDEEEGVAADFGRDVRLAVRRGGAGGELAVAHAERAGEFIEAVGSPPAAFWTGAAHKLHFAVLIVTAASESGEGRSKRACPDLRQLTRSSRSKSPASSIRS